MQYKNYKLHLFDMPTLSFSNLIENEKNPLFTQLSEIMGKELALKAFQMYGVQTVSVYGGSPVFWRRNTDGIVLGAVIESYPDGYGKTPIPNRFMVLTPQNSSLEVPKICFFGEHLLKQRPHARVVIVDDEKSALFCGMWFKDSVCLARGISTSPIMTEEMLDALSGRTVLYITFNRFSAGYVEVMSKARKDINFQVFLFQPFMSQKLRKFPADNIVDYLFIDIDGRKRSLEDIPIKFPLRTSGSESPQNNVRSGEYVDYQFIDEVGEKSPLEDLKIEDTLRPLWSESSQNNVRSEEGQV